MMGRRMLRQCNSNTQADSANSASSYQRAVDERFQSSAQSWRDVYFRNDLKARIRRERQIAALTMLERLLLPPQARILEVGCGAGLTTALLAKRGYSVVGIDTVPNMLDLARQEAVRAGVADQLTLIRQDVHEMAFSPNVFDLVLAIGVLPWSERPEQAIRSMAQVLRPGGYLLLSVDNQWCLNQILDPRCFPGLRAMRWKVANMLEAAKIRPNTGIRYRYYSIPRCDAMLSRAGLQKIEYVTTGYGPFTFFNIRLLPDSLGIKFHETLSL